MSLSKTNHKILFMVTGSIASYKACQVISQLVQSGAEVQVVATPSSLKFVGEATFEGLTGKPVLSEIFSPGQAMEHIHLARWADLAIVCPASAHSINKLAAGLADDLVGTLFLAYGRNKPFLLAPAMNSEMFSHPSVADSLKTLQHWGVKVLATDFGRLACGEVGYGKLLDPQMVLKEIHAALEPQTHGRVLVTAGATREPIDGVRFISNFSTGQTGAMIAEGLWRRGFNVHYLHGQDAMRPQNDSISQSMFSDFVDLNGQMEALLSQQEFQWVVHLAAVSDYSVASVDSDGEKKGPNADHKLRSSQPIQLQLKSNFKIVERLKSYSRNPEVRVAAFKLTHNQNVEKQVHDVNRLFGSDQIDMVVHNDLSEVSNENDGRPHIFHLFHRGGKMTRCTGKAQLIEKLAEEMGGLT